MKKGKVYLIGGGPGDSKLLTIKAKESLDKSDVIVYDRLVLPSTIAEYKDKELIYVGKASSDHTMQQEDINRLLVEKALQGKIVARLKGGDPYVFGRGGEEAQELIKEGIEFEIVPGISSSIGGLCYAGIPITHRDYSSSFHVFTGHFKDESRDHNWEAISGLKGTLVFLMGLKNLERIKDNLIKHGRAKSTPVAVISNATWSTQKKVVSDLDNIHKDVENSEIKSPALIVVGDVVKLNEELDFFTKRPLFAKTVINTRSRNQSSGLTSILTELGAKVLEVPTIRIEKINSDDLSRRIQEICKYTYIVFTSVNGVDIFFEELRLQSKDSRALSGIKIVSIGSATSERIMEHGIIPDIVPEKYIAESIYDSMKKLLKEDDRVLLPRAKNARKDLIELLERHCEVDEVRTYEAVPDIDDDYQDFDFEKADYVTFTSSSTVTNFFDFMDRNNLKLNNEVRLISIGPITSKTIVDRGYEVTREAEVYNIDGLVKAVLQDK